MAVLPRDVGFVCLYCCLRADNIMALLHLWGVVWSDPRLGLAFMANLAIVYVFYPRR